jgi:hypothetical protein
MDAETVADRGTEVAGRGSAGDALPRPGWTRHAATPSIRAAIVEGYVTYTMGTGGTWIAWHTLTEPPKGATGRDLMNCPGPVSFAVGPTADAALARLRAELSTVPVPESAT